MANHLSDEEKALLAADEKPRGRRRTAGEAADDASSDSARGPLTPVQWDDDGWGDTPVQMRG